jgi:hypothetical protein
MDTLQFSNHFHHYDHPRTKPQILRHTVGLIAKNDVQKRALIRFFAEVINIAFHRNLNQIRELLGSRLAWPNAQIMPVKLAFFFGRHILSILVYGMSAIVGYKMKAFDFR